MQVIMGLIAIFTLVWIFQGVGFVWFLLLLLGIPIFYIIILLLFEKVISAPTDIEKATAQRPASKRTKAQPKKQKPPSRKRSPKAASQPITPIPKGVVKPDTFDEALANLPAFIRDQSGSLFYTGRDAFSTPSSIYILGLNPGGDPHAQAEETVERAIHAFRHGPANWSAYQDESWQGAVPGTWGMQPRVLHLLKGLGLDPRSVPASNVIFTRSTTEGTLALDKNELITACWPVHQAVIHQLGIRIILCFGITAGTWVREQLAATEKVGEFRETNARGWTSNAHRNADGIIVITLTHPGRADWRNPAADPTPFVKQILSQN